MLRINSFKRSAVLVMTMSLVFLAVSLTAPSANAQTAITTIAQAETYLTTGREFYIDTAGYGAAEYTFRIASFDHDHSFVGYYYRGRLPASPNVTGSITVFDIRSIGRLRGIAVGISFTADAHVGGLGLVLGGTRFGGAIRLGLPGSKDRSFMAGTFNVLSQDGSSASTGPFPFTAVSNQ